VDDSKNPDVTEYMTLTEAAKLFPGRKPGSRFSTDTVWRWCLRGVGNGLRLRSVLIGGQRYTTRRWLQEFIDARNSTRDEGEPAMPRLRTPRQRQTRAERATEELKKLWKKA
jgi:hypothetical protein